MSFLMLGSMTPMARLDISGSGFHHPEVTSGPAPFTVHWKFSSLVISHILGDC